MNTTRMYSTEFSYTIIGGKTMKYVAPKAKKVMFPAALGIEK